MTVTPDLTVSTFQSKHLLIHYGVYGLPSYYGRCILGRLRAIRTQFQAGELLLNFLLPFYAEIAPHPFIHASQAARTKRYQ